MKMGRERYSRRLSITRRFHTFEDGSFFHDIAKRCKNFTLFILKLISARVDISRFQLSSRFDIDDFF